MKINEIVQRELSESEVLEIIAEAQAKVDSLTEEDTISEAVPLALGIGIAGAAYSAYDIGTKYKAYSDMKKAAGNDPTKLAQAEQFYNTEVKKAIGLGALGALTGGTIGAVGGGVKLGARALKKAKDLGRTAWNKIRGKNPPKITPNPPGNMAVSTGKGAVVGGVTGPGLGGQLAGGVDQAKDDYERYGQYKDDIDQAKNKLRNAFGPSGRGY